MKDQVRFMVGHGLLVVPILESGVRSLKAPLKGFKGRWYDYYHKIEVHQGDEIETNLERIGVFVKGGHIIPQFDVKANMKSSKHVKDADLFLFVGVDEKESAKGTMYFDDGETFDFTRGACTHKNIEFNQDTLTWTDSDKFGFSPVNKVARVKLMGHTKKFTHAYLIRDGGAKEEVEVKQTHGFIRVDMSAPANENWKLVFQLQA
jgi:alpha-glucosidase (family GH31 glycosyl hydrolase)